jgi:hypothetical protein
VQRYNAGVEPLVAANLELQSQITKADRVYLRDQGIAADPQEPQPLSESLEDIVRSRLRGFTLERIAQANASDRRLEDIYRRFGISFVDFADGLQDATGPIEVGLPGWAAATIFIRHRSTGETRNLSWTQFLDRIFNAQINLHTNPRPVVVDVDPDTDPGLRTSRPSPPPPPPPRRP